MTALFKRLEMMLRACPVAAFLIPAIALLRNAKEALTIVFLNSPQTMVEHKNPSATLSTPGDARTAVVFSNECGISSKSSQHSTKRIIL